MTMARAKATRCCVFSAQKKLNIPPEQRGLGFVFQDFALWPHMNVYENVAFGLRAANRTDGLDKKVRDALHAVRLDDFADMFVDLICVV